MIARALRRLFACALMIAVAWLFGLLWFVNQIPTRPGQDTGATDAIVVLTGGRGRIDYGLKLLAEGRAKRLFISGVEGHITPQSLVNKAQIAEGLEDSIMLGMDARNTIGNAFETAEWMRQGAYSSLRLVTANYHMPRALQEFRHAMPGIRIVADPVISGTVDINRWWRFGGADSKLILSEYHKLLAGYARHLFIKFTKAVR